MTPARRINVASGRPLESLAHYSRALRVGDTVLQSGTTAIASSTGDKPGRTSLRTVARDFADARSRA